MQAQKGLIKDEDQVSENLVEVYNWDDHCVVNKTSCYKYNELGITYVL